MCAKRVYSVLIDVSRVLLSDVVMVIVQRNAEPLNIFIHLFLVSTSVTAYGKNNRILQLNRLSIAARVNITHSNAK